MAHKKAQGSSKNSRDSKAKRLGVKLFGGEHITAGSIIVRQRGSKMILGKNVGFGKDYTIFSYIDGIVEFGEKRIKKFDGNRKIQTVVSVKPLGNL